MKITVIIPTYKPKDYLWECLDSMLKQTLNKNDFEIILVLNGCKEPFESNIRRYIESSLQSLNIKLIQVNQPGVSNARNIALDRACGEYITFIDDDDYISPTYLEELYKQARPDTVSLSNAIAFYEGTGKIEKSYGISNVFKDKHSKGLQSMISGKKYFSGPCMKLIHRNIIAHRKYDTSFKIGEDSQFMFLISDKIKYVSFTAETAIYYRRIRSGSAITTLPYSGRVKNVFKTIPSYTKVYIKGFPRYNFYFYLTRILGTFHALI